MKIEDISIPMIYIKDTDDDSVRLIGTNRHDVLTVNEQGALGYYNLQNGCGSPDTYKFCDKEGNNITDYDYDYIFCTPLIKVLNDLGYEVVKK